MANEALRYALMLLLTAAIGWILGGVVTGNNTGFQGDFAQISLCIHSPATK